MALSLWLLLGPACLSLVLLGDPVLALPKGTAAPEMPPGASSHSLRYFYTSLTESSPGLPHFIAVGYVDDQLFIQYDAHTRKAVRRVPWMEKAGEADPQYWVWNTQRLQNAEALFRVNLATLRERYNQTGGFHTWQWMYGCELRRDGSKAGHMQYAYDGRDFISLDKETLTWTAADVPAQVTKRSWEKETNEAQFQKGYLEETCIEWLQKYLDYGKETLLRTERPVGKVSRMAANDGQEALICQAHGFYPREIDATWTKGEENMDHETFRRNIAHNSDGTYHTWLSIEIDPKERDLYRCHLEHASLPKPMVLAYEESGVNMGVIVGAILGVLAILVIAAVIYFIRNKKQEKVYEAKPKLFLDWPDGEVKTDLAGNGVEKKGPVEPETLLTSEVAPEDA
ncbi:class I histocompatibility antigen, F10 alpha chain-like [Anolis carolinensis]|uniref:class I histocompatibility antigen, F10 alpha chain-like n=1 Tax=Anolis carolinensis TaxID=28377 RepID=UPI002F2B8B4F